MKVRRLPATIGSCLEAALDREPAHMAVIGSDRRLTYEELDAEADAMAKILHGWGLRRGHRVAVSIPNTTDIVVVFHAAMRLGAIWVGLNTNLAPPEKDFIITDSGASMLLASKSVIDGLAPAKKDLVVKAIPSDLCSVESADGSYSRPADLFDEPAGIAYTSGTTGRPKGVIHSHRNLLLPGAVLVEARGYDASLRRGDCAALTILNLQVTSTLLAAQACGTQVVMDRVDPVGIAQWIQQEQINSWFGVPTMLHGLASSDEVEPMQLEALQDVWTGGAELPTPIRSAFERKFNRRIHTTYGLTEVPTVVSIQPRDRVSDDDSSGYILPHLKVETASIDGHGRQNTEGELLVSGATTGPWSGVYRPMLGYHNRPAAGSLDDTGRLHTGDLGHIHEDELFVNGRRTSLILRGGSNVYPAEVERVILELTGVVGASVVGYPDERLGQRVAAAVELEPGSNIDEDKLVAHCVASLAKYKVPQRWTFRTLPRNAMGKVIRPDVERWFS